MENPFFDASKNFRCNVDNAFVRYADNLNTYVRSKRAGVRKMEAMRCLYARLKLFPCSAEHV